MRNEFDFDPRLRFFLGDVRDPDRLELAFRGIHTVIHAAALKQVPAGEADPWEFTATNVMGSRNVLDAARRAGVKKALLLSSDKACAPVTLYGASKLMAERLFTAANSYDPGGLVSASTRYGNVSGSRGSVIPLWREAGQAGRPVVVTDPDATRFHMTQGDAVRLVLRALGEMRGGEVFIPKLRSYRLRDLAMHLTGQPGDVVGLRGWEKRHEVLVSHDEMRHARDFGDHIRLLPEWHPWRSDEAIGGRPMFGSEGYGSEHCVMSQAELSLALSEVAA